MVIDNYVLYDIINYVDSCIMWNHAL